MASGQTAPGIYSALRSIFTIFEHGHSDCNAEKMLNWQQHQAEKQLELASEFVVTAMPPVPKGCTLFDEFIYMEDPHEVLVPSYC